MINLGKGHPNPRLLPLSHIRESFEAVSSRADAAVGLLQYGRMQGNERLCEAIAGWMGRRGGEGGRAPRSEEILVTTGSGPGFATIAQLFTRAGDVVLVDDPGFFLMYSTVEDCGLRAIGVRTDERGMDVGRVEELVRGGVRPRLVYTVPFANNPTGVGMSDERKRRLVELAREFGFKIGTLCDEDGRGGTARGDGGGWLTFVCCVYCVRWLGCVFVGFRGGGSGGRGVHDAAV